MTPPNFLVLPAAAKRQRLEGEGQAAALGRFDSDEDEDLPSRLEKPAGVFPASAPAAKKRKSANRHKVSDPLQPGTQQPQQKPGSVAEFKKAAAIFLRGIGRGNEQEAMKFEFKPWRPRDAEGAPAGTASADGAGFKGWGPGRRGSDKKFTFKKNYAAPAKWSFAKS